MAMGVADRVLTIVVTATLTSAFWIVAGGSLLDMAGDKSQLEKTRPAEAAPSPEPTPVETTRAGDAQAADPLHSGPVSRPGEIPDGALMIPVLNVRAADLTDTFSDARAAGERLHEAIDIMAPEGTTVRAAAPGTVEKLFYSDAGGNTIYVRSDDRRTIAYYAHLKDYAPGLKEGQKVRRGQRLGSVGSTGNASPDTPHLHFALLRTTPDAAWWEPATAINPYPLLVRGRN